MPRCSVVDLCAEAKLTPREAQVFTLYATGMSEGDIAESLGISRVSTINYASRARRKIMRMAQDAAKQAEMDEWIDWLESEQPAISEEAQVFEESQRPAGFKPKEMFG